MNPIIGAAEGEHAVMKRGQYSAWGYVVAGALVLCVVVSALIAAAIEALFALGADAPVEWIVAFAAGIGSTVAIFWDRWRVVEAFASRFCTGLANLSILIVTPIALGYALVRAVARLLRQEHRLAQRP